MFEKMKALMDLQKTTQELKRQLEKTTFEVQSADGSIRMTMNGAQQVLDVAVASSVAAMEKTNLEKAIKEVYNKAVKRSHEVAAEKMKDITGFSMPGLV